MLPQFSTRRQHSRLRSGLVRRNFEADQFGAKAVRAMRPISDTGSHPYKSQHQRRTAEMEPDEAANQESEGWRDQVAQSSARPIPPKVDERCGIHAHETDERAEIEHLRRELVGEHV